MKNTKILIEKLLTENPSNRDSDSKLTANYWHYELVKKGYNPKELNAFELLKLYAESKLTNASTIRRVRAKIQENNIHLRGKEYHIRQTKKQNTVKKNMGYETY